MTDFFPNLPPSAEITDLFDLPTTKSVFPLPAPNDQVPSLPKPPPSAPSIPPAAHQPDVQPDGLVLPDPLPLIPDQPLRCSHRSREAALEKPTSALRIMFARR